LPEKPASLLEKLFMLFAPRDYKNNAFVFNLPEVPEEFQDVARYLQRPVMDIDFHRMLLAEIEVDLMFDEQEMRHLKELEREQIKLERIKKQKALALREKKKAEKQKEKALTEKDKALTEKERAIIQKEEAIRHKQALAVKLARQMKKNGFNNKEILKETGLAIEALKKL
jgi:U3 small nucleolar RNA-associated protein 14